MLSLTAACDFRRRRARLGRPRLLAPAPLLAHGRRGSATSRGRRASSRSGTSTAAYKEFLAVAAHRGARGRQGALDRGQGALRADGQPARPRQRHASVCWTSCCGSRARRERRAAACFALLGNHEGDERDRRPALREPLRTTSRSETPRSQERARLVLPQAGRRRAPGGEGRQAAFRRSGFQGEVREADFPLGFVSGSRSSRPRAATASGCASCPPIAKIGGVVFLHGGAHARGRGARLREDQRHGAARDDQDASPEHAPVGGHHALRGRVRPALVPRHGARGRGAGLAAVCSSACWRAMGRARGGDRPHGDERRPDPRRASAGAWWMIDAGMNPLYGSNLAALEGGADGAMAALYKDLPRGAGPATKAAVLADGGGRR